MTIAELDRATRAKAKLIKLEAQEKATYDYILADLIGKSISRIYSSSNTLPDIAEVYPALFDNKEIQEKRKEKQAELSALRFKQFANSFNSKFNKEGAKEE